MSEQLKKPVGRVTHAANMCGVKPGTIWRWAKDTSLNFPKPIRLAPGTTVFDLGAVAAWIDSKKDAHPDSADAQQLTTSPTAPARSRNPVPASTNPARRKPGRPRKVALKGV